MDYEKKYKEALGRANAKIETYNHLGNASMVKSIYEIFPELKEKSEDERIRKAILSTIKSQGFISDEETLRQCVAWLEKQGEQKPADKVEPKFNVGDWIISSEGKLRHIVDVDKTGYQTDNGWLSHEHYEKRFHLWTIRDAKDGDVLACPNDAGDRDVVFIFKNINSDKGWVFCFCASDANGCFCTNNDYVGNSNSTNISPATKEQRDLLFQKMKEAGYEWDIEKKELKKIEQKPAWSEEDERNLQGVIDEIETNKHSAPDYDLATYDRFLSWLKSLKNRVQLQPKEDSDKPDWVDLGLPSGTLWKNTNETNPDNDHNFYTYDEAVQKFGDQLPTKEQWEELKDCCEWTWDSNGYKVVGKNGNSIFLHAAGSRNYCTLRAAAITMAM